MYSIHNCGFVPPRKTMMSATKLLRLTGCLRRNVLTNNAAFGTAVAKAPPARAAPAEAVPAAPPSDDKWEAARRAREAFEEAQAARAAGPGSDVGSGSDLGSGSELGSARPAPAGAAVAAAGVDEPTAAARPAAGREERQAAPAPQAAGVSRPAAGSRAAEADPAGAHMALQGAEERGRAVRGEEPTAGSSEADAGSVAARAAETPEEGEQGRERTRALPGAQAQGARGWVTPSPSSAVAAA